MKYFIDTEFIEGFHKPLFGKRRHFIDLVSIGIVAEDGREYYAISKEYDIKDASQWVVVNVIRPMYINTVHGDARNHCNVYNFHKTFGKSNEQIRSDILNFTNSWRDVHFWRAADDAPTFYGYYADYDWVLFCSLFGRMIDLPKGFPMYCYDLKQMLDENLDKVSIDYYGKEIIPRFENLEGKLRVTKLRKDYPEQENEHNALADAKWNKKLYDFIIREFTKVTV